jgi:hypothetical protein
MKKISSLFLVVFIIFGTYALAAPPVFGPPGISPGPGGDIPHVTYPSIMGTWRGNCKDIRHVDATALPYSVGPYTMTLVVSGQDGPRFAGWLTLDSEGGPQSCRVAGYITGDGEITMFGGVKLDHTVQRCNLTIKAKLYNDPNRSIRGSWQAFLWEEEGLFDKVFSASFVLSPLEPQNAR